MFFSRAVKCNLHFFVLTFYTFIFVSFIPWYKVRSQYNTLCEVTLEPRIVKLLSFRRRSRSANRGMPSPSHCIPPPTHDNNLIWSRQWCIVMCSLVIPVRSTGVVCIALLCSPGMITSVPWWKLGIYELRQIECSLPCDSAVNLIRTLRELRGGDLQKRAKEPS